MNREEAIKELTDLLPEEFLSEYTDAIKMAIEALEQEPCGDAISRQAVDRIINKWLSYPDYELKDEIYDMTKKIHKLPSVTPQPKMGRWINAKVGKLFPSNDYKCSECGNILDFDGVNCGRGDANYCPNCGAKMSEIPTGAEGSEE